MFLSEKFSSLIGSVSRCVYKFNNINNMYVVLSNMFYRVITPVILKIAAHNMDIVAKFKKKRKKSFNYLYWKFKLKLFINKSSCIYLKINSK